MGCGRGEGGRGKGGPYHKYAPFVFRLYTSRNLVWNMPTETNTSRYIELIIRSVKLAKQSSLVL
jgi:hypothetical protein